MKNSLLLLTLALGWLSIPTMAQTAQQTDPSVALEVDSNTKGFLPPRMSTRQRNAILNPATGLIIYNIDRRRLEYFNGILWASVAIIPITVSNTGISFIAVKTSDQSVSNNEKVTWENQYNQGGGFDDATDAFTAPVDGTYFFFVDAVSVDGDNVELQFYLNGSSTLYGIYDSSSEVSGIIEKAYGSMILFLNAGDTVDVRAFADSGVFGTTNGYSSRFGGFLLSR